MALFAPPIREFDGRKSLRSIVDALEKLDELDGLLDKEKATIRAMGLRLPDGRLTAFVSVSGPKRPDGAMAVVLMPSAARFRAKSIGGVRQTYPVPILDQALIDSEGNVRLANGAVLTQIDFIPAPAHYDLTARDRAIVLLTVVCLGVHEECYPEVNKELLPGLRRLRFDAIAGARVANLKTVLHFVNEHMFEPITLSVLSKTLARAGMQLPRSHH